MLKDPVRTYDIDLPRSGAITRLNPGQFSHTTTGELEPAYPVDVWLSYDGGRRALVIEFDAKNDPFVAQNTYTADNSAMWNQEVFEMFLSPGPELPVHYVEIELNPNGALFSARISNPNGLGTENSIAYFDGRAEGIEAWVTREGSSWKGRILFPLSILGSLRDRYRVNFFRVVSLQPHDPATPWACSPTSCGYLAWSPTKSGAVPAFHVPAHFGHLRLEHF